MRPSRLNAIELPLLQDAEATLDLVVPFTTPALTRVALAAGHRLGEGLNASIRLLKIQVVPYPLDLMRSPVPVDFLRDQMSRFESSFPFTREVRLAREFEPGLKDALDGNSLVVLAASRRVWRTRTERMAASLRRSGYTVALVWEGSDNNA